MLPDLSGLTGSARSKRIPDTAHRTIEEARGIAEAARRPEGATARQIAETLPSEPPFPIVQGRIKLLVRGGILVKEGKGRGTRYRAAAPDPMDGTGARHEPAEGLSLSRAGARIRARIGPTAAQPPVGYNRDFLESYRPNRTFYLSRAVRTHLRRVGATSEAERAAGTHAQEIQDRLLIEFCFNASRLEGTACSLLDAAWTVQSGDGTIGRTASETQMISNQKDALIFLVEAAPSIRFDRPTMLLLHALLSKNPEADAGVESADRHEADSGLQAEADFDRLLATAAAIDDPFEQAFFVLAQLPCLRPFDNLNGGVSRLAANIPFIRENLAPLSFQDVPRGLYVDALRGVCELNSAELLRDLFIWAYDRSAAHFATVKFPLAATDAFHFRHLPLMKDLANMVVYERMNRAQAAAYTAAWTETHIAERDRARFRIGAERELLSLPAGNLWRYGFRDTLHWLLAWGI